ncbi:MAG TPA: mercuric reductase, partial [Pirellulales bacterium]|jgi:pyruvate/2-oxoglutarate dehydrogenase complex dihydrolipoamide dehydrogenase (E3) component|nr:mercuric reductase [Pirellulales bacterium]
MCTAWCGIESLLVPTNMLLAPPDEHNQLLIERAHPSDWTNPTPDSPYNLVAIGGGTAGIIAALGTATLGGRAALIEQKLLGGDCLNYGCVPSKALVRAARAMHHLSLGERYGFRLAAAPQCDFGAIMQRMRRLRAQISQHDSARRFQAQGVDVYFGHARFTGRDRVDVDGRELVFRRAVIATGGSPTLPAVPGIETIDCLTNETIFSLTELPRRLIVIGGGPVGCELAQAFRRFGSEVHLVHRGETLLAKEEPAAGRLVQTQFEGEGIHLHLGWTTEAAEKVGDAKGLVIERRGERKKLLADAVLAATGRRPNVKDLGLEAAGVRSTDKGVEVDDRLRTSNPAIYAAGDVCSSFKFTHAADAMARLCVQNALFLGRRRVSRLVIPRCTYTDPEVAHVGLTAREAGERGIPFDTFRVDLAEVDRAIVDGEEEGFAAIHTRRGTGKMLGATIVAEHAGEMIGEVALAMTSKLPLSALAATIHCYPTLVEVLKRIADNYSRTRLTPPVATLVRKWLAWRR